MDNIIGVIFRGIAVCVVIFSFFAWGAGIALIAESFRRRNDWKFWHVVKGTRVVQVDCPMCGGLGMDYNTNNELEPCSLCDGEASIMTEIK